MNIKRVISLLLLVPVLASAVYSAPLATIHTDQNMEKGRKLGETYVGFYFLGFNDKDKAIYMVDLVGKGWVYWVDPTTGKIIQTQPQTYFDPNNARLSLDGKHLFSNTTTRPTGINYPNLLLLDSSNIKNYQKVKIGNDYTNIEIPHVIGPNRIAISLLEWTWDPKLKDYAANYGRGGRFEIWDWKKERLLGRIKDADAPGASQIFLGSQGKQKWVTSFYEYQKDYDYPAAFRPLGVLGFKDYQGNLKWRVHGSASHTVGYPIAQLSPTQIVSQSTIYQYPSKRILPLQINGERVRLLAMVPRQNQKMIVATKRGAELWDYAHKKRLHQWPEIKNIDLIKFSPDLRFFATQQYAKHRYDFYHFDSRWLK